MKGMPLRANGRDGFEWVLSGNLNGAGALVYIAVVEDSKDRRARVLHVWAVYRLR
jgi:hypothetical protein